MPWIMRLNWYDSCSDSPLVITVPEDDLLTSWQATQTCTVSRPPPWKALASVFEPEVLPSAPWQTLHLSLETMTRRGLQAAGERQLGGGVLHHHVRQRGGAPPAAADWPSTSVAASAP